MNMMRGCEGGPTLTAGDFDECAECGTRVAHDLTDHPFFGFAASCPNRERPEPATTPLRGRSSRAPYCESPTRESKAFETAEAGLRALEEAARKLRNEVSAIMFAEDDLCEVIGRTNLNALIRRRDELDTVLAALRVPQEEQK